MTRHCRLTLTRWAVCLLAAAAWAGGSSSVWGQGLDLADRLVSQVRVEGASDSERQLVMNQLRMRSGDVYDAEVVAGDIENITRLGRFSPVKARVIENADGSIDLVYVVRVQRVLADVQVVGNKAKSDQDIIQNVLVRPGDPIDEFLINRDRDNIVKFYRNEGFALADVSVDQQTLEESDILVFQVREGPKPRVRDIAFEGNAAFTAKQLRSQIKTEKYLFILKDGAVSDEQLEVDVAGLRRFYLQRGYLDVRVGRRLDLSDDQRDATVVFFVEEGRRYTVAKIEVEGNVQFSDAQIFNAMSLKVGDVFSDDRIISSNETLQQLYGKLGYIESTVQIRPIIHDTEPQVTVLVRLTENNRYIVGNTIIRGNSQTQEKVIRRQLRGLEPGRPYDWFGIEVTENRIKGTGLFREARVTVIGPLDDLVRDALIEVKEDKTGSVSFGAAVSSDTGLFGALGLTQRNFDITDTPESFGELLKGQAFRGAGQYFAITLQPGDEFQRYQVSFREPYIFDTNFFLDTNAFFFTRQREEFDEERVGGVFAVGKRFGDVWSASITNRYEQIELRDIDPTAPVDVFAVTGQSEIAGLGLRTSRSTVNSRFFPTRGTILNLGIERIGAFWGDFDFTRATAEFAAFMTVDEDFFGRKTVLSVKTETGYIIEENESPLFERYYAGGHRTFRGFRFRGVGPRGIAANTGALGDDPVGGDFLFLLKSEYNFPVWQEVVRMVVFADTGTVQQEIGLDEYRVAIGAGLRLTLPFFGQAPLAFDFAFPVRKEDGDETRFFSFDIALPF
ncbi:MAG: outer membrane protein assembly factor BamA [Planctomycetaceae bacterium]|nr:outer membrane protein assembly factor BamA [Planctomycetaceae bacterium]